MVDSMSMSSSLKFLTESDILFTSSCWLFFLIESDLFRSNRDYILNDDFYIIIESELFRSNRDYILNDDFCINYS